MKLFLLFALFAVQVSALSVLSFPKTPYEQIQCSVTFQVGGDAVVLNSVTAYSDPNFTVSAPGMVVTSPIPAVVPNTTMAVFSVMGGAVGRAYYFSVKATDTVNGNNMEATVVVHVTY